MKKIFTLVLSVVFLLASSFVFASGETETMTLSPGQSYMYSDDGEIMMTIINTGTKDVTLLGKFPEGKYSKFYGKITIPENDEITIKMTEYYDDDDNGELSKDEIWETYSVYSAITETTLSFRLHEEFPMLQSGSIKVKNNQTVYFRSIIVFENLTGEDITYTPNGATVTLTEDKQVYYDRCTYSNGTATFGVWHGDGGIQLQEGNSITAFDEDEEQSFTFTGGTGGGVFILHFGRNSLFFDVKQGAIKFNNVTYAYANSETSASMYIHDGYITLYGSEVKINDVIFKDDNSSTDIYVNQDGSYTVDGTVAVTLDKNKTAVINGTSFSGGTNGKSFVVDSEGIVYFRITFNVNRNDTDITQLTRDYPANEEKIAPHNIFSNYISYNTHIIFTGWNTKADGSGISYSQGDIMNINSNISLYAQWAKMVIEEYNSANRQITVNSALSSEYIVIFANYENKILKDIDIVPYEFTDGENTISHKDGLTLNSGDKIMIFENSGSIKPICSSYIIK